MTHRNWFRKGLRCYFSFATLKKTVILIVCRHLFRRKHFDFFLPYICSEENISIFFFPTFVPKKTFRFFSSPHLFRRKHFDFFLSRIYSEENISIFFFPAFIPKKIFRFFSSLHLFRKNFFLSNYN